MGGGGGGGGAAGWGWGEEMGCLKISARLRSVPGMVPSVCTSDNGYGFSQGRDGRVSGVKPYILGHSA